MARGQRGCRVQRVRHAGRGLDEIVERAGGGAYVIGNGGECAPGVDTHADGLPGWRAMADGAEHLVPPQHELYGRTHQPGSQDTEQGWAHSHTLGAEAAANERRAYLDLLRCHPDHLRQPRLRDRQPLCRHIERQPVPVPHRHDGVRLHRVMVLGGRVVGLLDRVGSRLQPGCDIATAVEISWMTRPDHLRHERFGAV